MLLRRSAAILALLLPLAFLAPMEASAAPRAKAPTASSGVTCSLPESNAEALDILSNYYPGYWWDHTDLTVAVQAHPRATEEQLAAIHDAIATWGRYWRTASTGSSP